jgi:hypothetical protein
VRDTTIEGAVGNNNFRFEGSQPLPASPSDKGEACKLINSTGPVICCKAGLTENSWPYLKTTEEKNNIYFYIHTETTRALVFVPEPFRTLICVADFATSVGKIIKYLLSELLLMII